MTDTGQPGPHTRSLATPLIFLAVVAFLELTLLLWGLALGAEGDDVLVLVVALLTVLVGAAPVLFNMTQPPERRQILITLITVVFVIYLVVPVFTQYFLMKGEYVAGHFRLSNYLAAEVLHAQVVALLGLAMLLIGFYLPFGRIAVSVVPKPTREWPAHAVLFVSLFTLGLGWVVFVLGQLHLLPSRAGSGVLGTLASGSYFGISLLTLAWLRHRRPEALLLLAVVIPLSMLFNFFTGSKRMFLTPPFMFALAYIVYEKRVRMTWVAAGFAALIVLYPVSEFYRSAVQTDELRRVSNFLQNPGETLAALSRFRSSVDTGSYLSEGLKATGKRLDGLGVLTEILKDTPERVPFQGGWTIGYIALSYVPRLIWADKPAIAVGEWVSQTYGSPLDLTTDVGPTWIGEFYFNWGYPGIVFGMFTLGLLCRAFQERLFGENAPIPALLGGVVVLYAFCRSVQSGLNGPINGTIFNLAPILIAHQLVGMFTGYQRTRATRPDARVGAGLSQAPASPAR
jgi:hypothetical protein